MHKDNSVITMTNDTYHGTTVEEKQCGLAGENWTAHALLKETANCCPAGTWAQKPDVTTQSQLEIKRFS